MISGTGAKKIYIHITTYKREELSQEHKMDTKANRKCNKFHNKYVCALCLNPEKEDKTTDCCNKKIPKGCPICFKSRDACSKKDKERTKTDKDEPDKTKKPDSSKEPNFKTVQTSETTVAQGLSLLNEVLTVFQNKKVDMNKEKVKSGLVKDVAVSTEEKNKKNSKDRSRLTVSTFQYSIDNTKKPENGKFTIVNCCQPEFVKKQHSIDLIKHKSCSIPQMKLEELKYSLKEKSRSKDAIEEVNRMFATVRRSNGKSMENNNRPMVRSGPRILPVVKNNNTCYANQKELGVECNNIQFCKCCQTCLSSGDSFITRNECCHDTEKETCDKCVYMMCCHYENKCKRQAGVLICEHCRNLNEDYHCHENYVDDSS